MYLQDEKQQIVGYLNNPGEWGETYDTSRMWTKAVIIPEIGAFVTYEGKSYVIISTQTFQEEDGISTLCRILAISDEGDDLGEEPKSVDSDKLALI